MFSTDRDLLVHEPGLFDQVSWLAQRLFSGKNALLDTTGTLVVMPEIDTAKLGLTAGSVICLDGIGPTEVVSRRGSTLLEVSKLRGSRDDQPVPVGPANWSGQSSAHTFAPQRSAAHSALLARLNIAAGKPPSSWTAAAALAGAAPVYVSQIINPQELAQAETLATLAIVWAGAAAHPDQDSGAWARARAYRDRAQEALAHASASIDLDADGSPETHRTAGARHWRRG